MVSAPRGCDGDRGEQHLPRHPPKLAAPQTSAPGDPGCKKGARCRVKPGPPAVPRGAGVLPAPRDRFRVWGHPNPRCSRLRWQLRGGGGGAVCCAPQLLGHGCSFSAAPQHPPVPTAPLGALQPPPAPHSTHLCPKHPPVPTPPTCTPQHPPMPTAPTCTPQPPPVPTPPACTP